MTAFPHADHLGSPLAETGLSGAVDWRESYTPYGEKRLDPVLNRDNQGFTGHVDDAATGLTYMQARYYNPVVGRFLSNDPVAFAPDRPQYFNRYSYVGNDTVNMWDPDGRACVPCLAALPPLVKAAITTAGVGTGAALTVKAVQDVSDTLQNDNSSSGGGGTELTPGTRNLGDLEPMDAPGHNESRPELEDLSDEELVDSVENPADGQKVKVRGNDLRDGNGRINEMKNRGFPDDTAIPVEELPEDPIAPWED